MTASRSTDPSHPEGPPAPEGSASRGLWVVILVLLTPAVVLPLWVGLYDRTTPELFGFPFYFWFQMALIPLAAALTTAALVLSQKADRRDREARAARSRGARREGGA